MAEHLLLNDVHLSDRAPSSCTDTYNDDLFTLLGEISRIATERDADGIILAGDVFHHKTPSRTSHSTVMRLIQTARHAPCPVYAVPGNHDLSHDRLDSLTESQPLGVVFESEAIQELNGWHPSENIYGIPWLPDWNDQAVQDALAEWRAVVTPQPALVVTHAPLYPPGRELKFENYPAAQFADAMGNRGTVHYGHVHEPHGVYTVNGVVFSNSGALSRGSLHEHNLTRPVQVACWNSETGAIRHLTVPHKPADEVFRIDEAGRVKSATQRLDQFIDAVGSTQLTAVTRESVVDHVRGLGLGKDLENLALELLTEVS